MFMFINSEPPQFRKARELAVSIENHEALFLSHVSYVDTTRLEAIPDNLVQTALGEVARNHGAIAPFLRTRIKDGVDAHQAMETPHRDKVLND
ncbi:MAG: hypothetical protein R3D70_05970 [Rhizobiaceae bacterium]